jgi:2-iminoacetate synthase ThiH
MPLPSTPTEEPPATQTQDDFYYEGDFVVFTAAYHLRRGYCCESDCRHCPYRTGPEEEQPATA